MFGRAVAALRRPRLGPALTAALHLAALALFTHGFLLTRVHLEERSTAAHAGTDNASSGGVGYGAANSSSTQGAPFNRVVWLMIDALRYDFVISDGRYTCPGASTLQQQQQQGLCHQGHMPYLAGLARQVCWAGRVARWVLCLTGQAGRQAGGDAKAFASNKFIFFWNSDPPSVYQLCLPSSCGQPCNPTVPFVPGCACTWPSQDLFQHSCPSPLPTTCPTLPLMLCPTADRRTILHVHRGRTHHHHAAPEKPGDRRAALLL